jgi:Glycosyltransferase family 87
MMSNAISQSTPDSPEHRHTGPWTARAVWLWVACAVLILLALGAYSVALLIPVYNNSAASDFATFYYPAARLIVAGADPYTISFYVQPPALLLVFAPLTALPPETARAVWLGVETLIVAGGVAATLYVYRFRLTRARAIFVLAVFLSPNIIWGVLIGQSVVLMFGLQALGLWLLRRNHPFWAGMALGAVVLKPHLLAVELPVLLSAPRRAWAGAALAIGGLLLGPELAGIHLRA